MSDLRPNREEIEKYEVKHEWHVHHDRKCWKCSACNDEMTTLTLDDMKQVCKRGTSFARESMLRDLREREREHKADQELVELKDSINDLIHRASLAFEMNAPFCISELDLNTFEHALGVVEARLKSRYELY